MTRWPELLDAHEQSVYIAAEIDRLAVDGGPLVEVAHKPSGLIRAALALIAAAAMVWGALVVTGVG